MSLLCAEGREEKKSTENETSHDEHLPRLHSCCVVGSVVARAVGFGQCA